MRLSYYCERGMRNDQTASENSLQIFQLQHVGFDVSLNLELFAKDFLKPGYAN